jgi:hypothetical protein
MVGAALSAGLTTFGAFLAAALSLIVFTRAFGAALLALGTTRFSLLFLVGLRCAGLTLAHCDRKGSQEEREQHNEHSALSGFHFVSPIGMMITVGHQRTQRHLRCETLAS